MKPAIFNIATVGSCVPVISCLIALSCATTGQQEKADFPAEIARLESKLQVNPDNADALRDLGAMYCQTRQFRRAKEYLQRASAKQNDAKTLFYYGMTLESDSSFPAALAVYVNYTDFSVLSPYRKLMEGRYRALARLIIQRQMHSLASEEEKLGDPTSSNTLAVFPLNYQGGEEKFSSLGKGLGEMMINDLAQVSSLKLVERIRTEALLEELRFGATGKVDPSTAPRLGKFLSAGRIVGGAYNVSTEGQLRMDVISWDVIRKRYPEPTTQADALENLFRVEKDLVFGVLKDMGITLTKEETERIQRIPTKNLQAFMMYCLGLEREDAFDFKAAEVYYAQAVSLDPNFSEARTKASAMESLSLSGSSMDQALAAAYALEPGAPPLRPSRNLRIMRLQNMGWSLGSSFRPGVECRNPPEEAARAGASVGDLPTPPKPPGQ